MYQKNIDIGQDLCELRENAVWVVCTGLTAFVSSLCVAGEPVDMASTVTCLLHCLPLLRTGNAPAKAAYLHVLPTVLRRSTDTGLYLPDCQQILSYALIHPAISGDELIPLHAWQPQLHDDVSRVSCEHVINGPTISSVELVSNCRGGGGMQPAAAHRDLTAVRSLPVGLLHGGGGATRPSRTTAAAAAGTVYVQQSSPPPAAPRALTPPRLSEFSTILIYICVCVLRCLLHQSLCILLR